MVVINVDGKSYEVDQDSNLLESCLSLGIEIPYFCWHPALGSVGSCRLCAIKKYQNVADTQGIIMMSCMTSVEDGMSISVIDEEVKYFRKSILELLMINHPHDCPVCSEAGHCHLQDMTVITGHNFRRYRFTKRTHLNQNLGPFILHEMNRCISCYRCVRYYNDYAGGNDLGVYGSRDDVYFGRIHDGVLESEFSGNLIEICPTGVFTNKTNSDEYNRKWDMQFAPSICQHCSVGCNISIGERYGRLSTVENRYNRYVNGYFLCDLGRFGHDFVNDKDRPKTPMRKFSNNDHWVKLNMQEAIKVAVSFLQRSKRIVGIGSSHSSLENNFALRELVGEDNFYTGINPVEQDILLLILDALHNKGLYTPSLHEIETYDAILILGEDVTQTAARVALSIRQAVKNQAYDLASSLNTEVPKWHSAAVANVARCVRYPLFITSVDSTKLDDIALWTYFGHVDDQARLAFALAHALDPDAPTVDNFDISLNENLSMMVQMLSQSRKPLIISGTHSGSKELVLAAINIVYALKNSGIQDVGISFILSASNTMGLIMMGGGNIDDAFYDIEKNSVDCLIVLENNLYRNVSNNRVNDVLSKIDNIILLDYQKNTVMDKANLVLSSTSFVESNGTLVSQEGRAQRFFSAYNPNYYNHDIVLLDSWRWLHLLHVNYLGHSIVWDCLDRVIDSIEQFLPQFLGIKKAAPDANFRIKGQKLARSPHRYSGRTSIVSNFTVQEPAVPYDHDTMFTFSMEGNNDLRILGENSGFVWSPGWNSPQSLNKYHKKINGHLFNNSGFRLLEPKFDGSMNSGFFNIIPKSSFLVTYDKYLRVAPYWHLFGSGEMSQYSLSIELRRPSSYVMLSKYDSIKFGINSGVYIKLSYFGEELSLPVKISDKLDTGQLGLPLGLPGIPLFLLGMYFQYTQDCCYELVNL